MPKPEIMCHIPHKAAIKAMPPNPSNKFGLKIKTSPNPEFWIPVSIEMVLLSLGLSLKIVGSVYPTNRPNALCTITINTIKCTYLRK